jgi:hypothetical protein
MGIVSGGAERMLAKAAINATKDMILTRSAKSFSQVSITKLHFRNTFIKVLRFLYHIWMVTHQ